MSIKSFEEIFAWQKSKELWLLIYQIFKWEKCKDQSFIDQIKRAALSIMNNIAEWFERQTNKEFKNFLYIAKWSCWEVRSMISFAYSLWYITKDEFIKINNLSIEISKILSWFIKTL